MTPEEASATESTILAACRAIVTTLAPKLAAHGLECESPELSVCNSESDHYCSEVRAMILRNGQIADVLEFFIFENARPTITLDAAEQYTRQVLLDAVNRR